jgi:hypothetical protein
MLKLSQPQASALHGADRACLRLALLGGSMPSQEDELDLQGIQWNWEGAYPISRSQEGKWLATSEADPSQVLEAYTADELRELIRKDYDSHPFGDAPKVAALKGAE